MWRFGRRQRVDEEEEGTVRRLLHPRGRGRGTKRYTKSWEGGGSLHSSRHAAVRKAGALTLREERAAGVTRRVRRWSHRRVRRWSHTKRAPLESHEERAAGVTRRALSVGLLLSLSSGRASNSRADAGRAGWADPASRKPSERVVTAHSMGA